jgi:hypothetical protein
MMGEAEQQVKVHRRQHRRRNLQQLRELVRRACRYQRASSGPVLPNQV